MSGSVLLKWKLWVRDAISIQKQTLNGDDVLNLWECISNLLFPYGSIRRHLKLQGHL